LEKKIETSSIDHFSILQRTIKRNPATNIKTDTSWCNAKPNNKKKIGEGCLKVFSPG